MFFWNSLAFSTIQQMLAIWSLVPLPFLKPAGIPGSSRWSLAGEFWASLYQCVRWVQLCGSLSILWHCLSLGLEWKLTFSSPGGTADQEAMVRTGHGATDWFQIGKGVRQSCILSPCLFNFYADYIMRNARLEKHKLESRLPEETSITSAMQMTPLLWQKVKRN